MTRGADPRGERPLDGGMVARQAMVRWAWRLFRREWRQQLLVLSLITVAVAVTTVAVGVAVNTPIKPYVGFGTAHDLATFSGRSPSTSAEIATLRQRYGAIDEIDNRTVTVPGSVSTFDLRAQDPSGPFGRSLVALVSGRFAKDAHEVDVTAGVASDLNLRVGSVWRERGVSRRVVGIVENPQNLLDEFALVVPGQVTSPTTITVLFDAPPGTPPKRLGSNVITTTMVAQGNAFNPETISIALVTVTMMMIALVAIAGFTVIAQRRLRSIGMLGALGATDAHIRLVVRANGLFVGLVGALVGFLAGLLAWLAYRPTLERSAHHVVGVFALPWTVIIVAVVLAVAAAYFASTRPARAMTRISTVAALAGRPAAPRQLRRSAVPGLVLAVVAFFLLGVAGASGGKGGGGGALALGFVTLIVAVVMVAPFVLTLLDRMARRAPLTIRMSMRDLARYRARSGAALGAISMGVLIAVVVIIASAARFSNVLDYAGPNLSSTQIIIYTPNGPYGTGGPGNPSRGAVTGHELAAMAASAQRIAASVGSRSVVTLETTSATLQHAAPGRSYSGPLYVATPQLLAAFHVSASSVRADAQILSMRPGFAGLSNMQIVFGNYFAKGGPGEGSWPCPSSDCLANPSIQEVAGLPAGTSAPNTVITEYAVKRLGLATTTSGWLVQTASALSASQLTNVRGAAAAAGLSIESKSSMPTSATIVDWATLVGVVLALGILAMTIGLIRSETAGDLRILMATGASRWTRRGLTAATAGALALVGAVLGTAAAYLAMVGFSRTSALDGLSSLAAVPVINLLLILVAMPLVATVIGWLAAWREPVTASRQLI
ncbi:MAG: FtsX-like permease family protein [Acidobacteria bacterium]|nr:FtsX-like permease family protein [Acidobacteriota bacterium]